MGRSIITQKGPGTKVRSGPSICPLGTQFGNADFYILQLRALGIINASMPQCGTYGVTSAQRKPR